MGVGRGTEPVNGRVVDKVLDGELLSKLAELEEGNAQLTDALRSLLEQHHFEEQLEEVTLGKCRSHQGRVLEVQVRLEESESHSVGVESTGIELDKLLKEGLTIVVEKDNEPFAYSASHLTVVVLVKHPSLELDRFDVLHLLEIAAVESEEYFESDVLLGYEGGEEGLVEVDVHA